MAQPDEILIGGAHAFGVAPPVGDEILAVMQGKDGVGISDIDGEKHRHLLREMDVRRSDAASSVRGS